MFGLTENLTGIIDLDYILKHMNPLVKDKLIK